MGTQPRVQSPLQKQIYGTAAQEIHENRYQKLWFCLALLDFFIFLEIFWKGLSLETSPSLLQTSIVDIVSNFKVFLKHSQQK